MLLPRPALQAALAALLLGCGALLGYLAAGKARDGEELISLRQEMHGMRQLVTLSLLQQQSASERLEGVSWSRRLERPDPEVQNALFDALRHDQSVNVRLAALEALRPLAAQEPVRRQLMDSLSAQPSPLVQISLIDLMVEIRERKAVEALRRISIDENANPTVRKRAGWGLQQLGGL
jgi:HEAT repeat protein